ncbi:MAG: T9SS type A sorting domain-containing protein [Bacteroidota bacterium]|nr:T9SS type A sorting domain-containing protein [Bacteroidota bacterium]
MVSLQNRTSTTHQLNYRCFPNPAREYVNISIKESNKSKQQNTEFEKIEIFDIAGRKVAAFEMNRNEDISLVVHQWEKGMYFISLRKLDGKARSIRLVVE